MLYLFLVSPPKTTYPIPTSPTSMRVFSHPPTFSRLTTLAFAYTAAFSFIIV